MKKVEQEKIQDIITNILSLLQITEDQFALQVADSLVTVQLNVPTEESGVFIGAKGETLGSLQLILALVVSQRLGDWIRVKVNVGDYQQRREEQLISKADQAANRALETGQEIVIPGLNSYERHLVHEYLAQNDAVKTESRGEGSYRQLFVSPSVK